MNNALCGGARMERKLEKYKKHPKDFSPVEWKWAFYDFEQSCYWPSEEKIKRYKKLLTESKEEFYSLLANSDSLLELFEVYFYLKNEDSDISVFAKNVVTLFWYLVDSFNYRESFFSEEYIEYIIKLYELNQECFYILLKQYQSNAVLIQNLLIKSPILCKIDIVSQLELGTQVFVPPSDNRFQLDDEIIQEIKHNLLDNFNSFGRDYMEQIFSSDLFHSPYLDIVIQCIKSNYQDDITAFNDKINELIQEFNTMHYSWAKTKEESRNKYYSIILSIKVYSSVRSQLLSKQCDIPITSFESIIDKQILYTTDLERVNETIDSIFCL